jgi:hypothetical protein
LEAAEAEAEAEEEEEWRMKNEEWRISPNMFDIIQRSAQLTIHPRSATTFDIFFHAMPIS